MAFLGIWAETQDWIDLLIERYTARLSPQLGGVMTTLFFTRLRDDDRGRLAAAIAGDLGVGERFSHVVATMNRLKKQRDLFAH